MAQSRLRAVGIGLGTLLILGGVRPVPTCAAAWDDNRFSFARHLIDEGDTFRAISVLKEMAWRERDSSRVRILDLTLGEAYRKSGRPEQAAHYYEKALSHGNAPDSLDQRGYIGLSLVGTLSRRFSLAEEAVGKVTAPGLRSSKLAVEGLILAERGAYHEAAYLLHRLAKECPSANPELDVIRWAERFEKDRPDERQPALAALFSAVIPGAGQLYSGHVFDAAQALFFVGAFSVASIAAYPDRSDGGAQRLTFAASCTLTGLFYTANILGAHRVAGYHNLKEKEEFIGGFRAAVSSLDF